MKCKTKLPVVEIVKKKEFQVAVSSLCNVNLKKAIIMNEWFGGRTGRFLVKKNACKNR